MEQQDSIRERVYITFHSKPVLSVAFSPDGKTLVYGSGDNTIKIWRGR
ncbi:WD40 domain-containing protein [Anabaenopsis tanganyikae CS-531]|uniref:WD40 domain-containing protein n=1 Tax=Anabaenopsis tanganyikae CS-531 TaxID=2785304 RepID=A0ABT6KIJ8_9CYAN|nr:MULTISPECIES: WD40 repeat domain-containing protein [Anabaenopsis]MDH6100448.1 WD40 domain-containing protein [Anabaenopsis sp. FSS-46]MDH6107154.1 WD40 domain-containing protein [Anabaenopsis tanganyikae CS-531]